MQASVCTASHFVQDWLIILHWDKQEIINLMSFKWTYFASAPWCSCLMTHLKEWCWGTNDHKYQNHADPQGVCHSKKQNYQNSYKYILNSLKLLNLSSLLRMTAVLLKTETGLKTLNFLHQSTTRKPALMMWVIYRRSALS